MTVTSTEAKITISLKADLSTDHVPKNSLAGI